MACTPRTLFYISPLLAPVLARAETTVDGMLLSGDCWFTNHPLFQNGSGVYSRIFSDPHVGACHLCDRDEQAAAANLEHGLPGTH